MNIFKLILFLTFFIIFIYFYKKTINCEYIINDSSLNNLFNKNIDIIHYKTYLSNNECNNIINKLIINNIKNWTAINNNNKISKSDVFICKYPLSQVFDNIINPEIYFNQVDIFKNINNPIDNLFNNCKEFKIKIGEDDKLKILYPNFINKYLKTILRIYKSNKNNINKNGMIHNDVDETGIYKDYDIFTINIYLKVPENGGSLKIWKSIFEKEIFPQAGDVIIFNPELYHSVQPFPKGERISLQTFLLKHKYSNKIFIRV